MIQFRIKRSDVRGEIISRRRLKPCATYLGGLGGSGGLMPVLASAALRDASLFAPMS